MTIVMIGLAYVLTGLHYVWRDLRQPIIEQPGYVREYTVRGRLRPLLVTALLWLPASLYAVSRRQAVSANVASWVTFFALLVGASLMNNS